MGGSAFQPVSLSAGSEYGFRFSTGPTGGAGRVQKSTAGTSGSQRSEPDDPYRTDSVRIALYAGVVLVTKDELLAKARLEFEALDQLITRLEPADWERPVPRPESRDPWTVKDAVAHILHWKALTIRRVRGLGRPADERRLTISEINHRVYERWREQEPEAVVAWHHELQAEAVAALEARPPEWFTARERGADWLGDLHSHSSAHRRRDILAVVPGSDDRGVPPG